ncbi:MAG: PVC-type heme-binding CxxCH protein [Pirellulales bacterium]
MSPRLAPIAWIVVACGAAAGAVGASSAEPELPELTRHGGVVRADLNGDGHDDLVVSNGAGYGVWLFVSPGKAVEHLEWKAGWTRVLREGKPGDPAALPRLDRDGVRVEEGDLVVGDVRIPREELLRVPGPPPRSPPEALAALRVPAGLEVTLAAAEPAVMDPVCIDFDERGRMWVAEMGDYPFAEGEATGDGSVTWQDGVPGEGAGRGLMHSRIRILEDADEDGVYESSRLFLDGLRHVTGLACWDGGVFVAGVPDIFFARDDDGDGRCDRRETWYTGFTAGNPQHLVNGFCLGLDGWFHGANGDSGGSIECVRSGERVELGRYDFRFDPRSGAFRREVGMTQVGKWRDDFGNWFGTNNALPGWHYWLPLAHLERHPDVVVAAPRADLTPDRRVRPQGEPQRRLNQPSQAGMVTSACHPMPYRDTVLGSAAVGAIFIAEPAHNLVLRRVLDYSGPTIAALRHPDDTEVEFLTSSDRWFRPIMARTGPDGALYVVDMARLVLEHPEWVPAEMARRMQLRGGETLGRIWRVAPPGHPATRAPVSLASTSGWARDTAQRLALERGVLDDEVAARALADHESPAMRVQALFTLDCLGLLPAGELVARLGTEWPLARGAALVAAGGDGLAEGEAILVEAGPEQTAKPVPSPVLAPADPDRQAVVARYAAAASHPGDPVRGRAVFTRAGCAACHKLGDEGVELGPDLATVGRKPTTQIIEAIFDPDRAVEQRYAATVVVTDEGVPLQGIVVAETPGSLTLRLAGGGERILRRGAIESISTLPRSLMPAGLEQVLSPDDCADLLAALQAP